MVDIVHRIGVKAPPSKVYAALATAEGVAGWWTRETRGTSEVGQSLHLGFRSPAGVEIGQFELEVLELAPDQRVRWRVKQGPPDWIGTEVDFTLSQADGLTIVLFGHRKWKEAGEGTAHCSMKWATFLLSLRSLVETGRGRPSPDDLKIDNWN
jgi:uncharacterized protein YndB with AHSA1/START domain